MRLVYVSVQYARVFISIFSTPTYFGRISLVFLLCIASSCSDSNNENSTIDDPGSSTNEDDISNNDPDGFVFPYYGDWLLINYTDQLGQLSSENLEESDGFNFIFRISQSTNTGYLTFGCHSGQDPLSDVTENTMTLDLPQTISMRCDTVSQDFFDTRERQILTTLGVPNSSGGYVTDTLMYEISDDGDNTTPSMLTLTNAGGRQLIFQSGVLVITD